MKDEDFFDVIIKEFVCYYHADMLFDNWYVEPNLTELATASASRLEFFVPKVEDRYKLILLMQQIVDDKNHPMNKMISDRTDIEWYIEDEDWLVYKMLLESIIKNMHSRCDNRD